MPILWVHCSVPFHARSGPIVALLHITCWNKRMSHLKILTAQKCLHWMITCRPWKKCWSKFQWHCKSPPLKMKEWMQEKFCTRVSIITSKGCAAHSSWYSSVQKSHVLTFFPPINLDLSAFTGALFKNSFKYFPHGVTRLKGCSLRMFPRCLCLHLKNVALWWRFIKVQKKNIILLSFCGWLGLLEKN